MASRLPDEEADRIYAICRIDHLLKRWTSQLSGGERQRIALARLLVGAPQLLLLDEPYSNLDAIHKNILKGVIQELSERLDITCLLVSHDPLDVLSWADEILVLQEGRLVQQGPPAEVYNQPVNEYAAALFGTYNPVSPALMKLFFPHSFVTLNNINRFIRPEHFTLSRQENTGVRGEVAQVRFMGSYFEMQVAVAGNTIRVNQSDNGYKKGDAVYVSLTKRHAW